VAAALAGYVGIFPPEAPLPTAAGLIGGWQRAIACPTDIVLVAHLPDEPDRVVGGVIVTPAAGLLSRLYVDPEAWGSGVGSVLHDTALAVLRDGGCREARLWVLERNSRARRMYERRGWRLVAGKKAQPEWPEVVEVAYERALEPRTVEIKETYVMLLASDMDRAVRFWRDGLGLRERFITPHWSELECGETVVALHGGAEPGEGVPEVLGLRVDDVHDVVAAVTENGGWIVDGPSQPAGEGIWLATCTDTEGNRFFLSAPVEAA
jgi:GNAT superfamily N-acetyltransferase/predicted enzyme related to lactoylglutathione lyase